MLVFHSATASEEWGKWLSSLHRCIRYFHWPWKIPVLWHAIDQGISAIMKSGFSTKTFNSWDILTMNIIILILKLATKAEKNMQKITHMGQSSVADPLHSRQVLKTQHSREFKTEFPPCHLLEVILRSIIKINSAQNLRVKITFKCSLKKNTWAKTRSAITERKLIT